MAALEAVARAVRPATGHQALERMRLRAAALLVLVLLMLDQLAKSALVTEGWAYHSTELGLSFVAVAAACVAFAWRFPTLRAPMALILAGVLGNAVSALLGPVSNPFELRVTHGVVAFNLADVFIVLGAALTALYGVAAAVSRFDAADSGR